MIIKSSKYNSRSIAKEKVEKKSIVSEEIKPVVETKKVSKTERKRKNILTPVIEEPIIEVVEEKTEDEDLSQWLEEHTED